MEFVNSTELDGERLQHLFVRHTLPYAHTTLKVHVRYSRKADFSGTCFYRDGRIFVNLGRRNRYPYTFVTHIAKARSNRTHWWRESFRLEVADACQLALFVYLHELFHHLVKVAGRSVRRKEAMCDRFATRVLVDEYRCALTDNRGRPVARERWDFQDLDALIAAAPRQAPVRPKLARPAPAQVPAPRAIPVIIHGTVGVVAVPTADAVAVDCATEPASPVHVPAARAAAGRAAARQGGSRRKRAARAARAGEQLRLF